MTVELSEKLAMVVKYCCHDTRGEWFVKRQ